MEVENTKRKRDDEEEEEEQEDIDVEDIEENKILSDGKTEENKEDEESHFKRRDEMQNSQTQQESPEIIEKTEVFEIKSDPTFLQKRYQETNGKLFSISHTEFHLAFIHDIDRMRKAGYCDEEKVAALWEQKSRLDDIFDAGKGEIYHITRDRLFPQDKKGSSLHWNRAGDKLMQVDESVNILEGIENGVRFLDVCGGPGAFSQYLLSKEKVNFPCKGYGITLITSQSAVGEIWYNDLKKKNFRALYGKDTTGNVYLQDNLNYVAEQIADDNEKINIVVSDGGFLIQKNEEGIHMENFQELYSGRIILSEILAMMKVLQPGGHFVCKLYDCFSDFTVSLIYIVSQIFEKTFIVKPLRSRIVNSERYLVGKKLKEKSPIFDFLLDVVSHLHRICNAKQTPKSIFPTEIFKADSLFINSIKEMVGVVVEKQTLTLKKVMDEVDNEVARGNQHRNRNRNKGNYHNNKENNKRQKGRGFQYKRRRY